MTRQEALAKLRQSLAKKKPLIGAGAGTGLSAKCAEAGGADLIIIYNSGRYRMAGPGSLAGLLPAAGSHPSGLGVPGEAQALSQQPPAPEGGLWRGWLSGN